MAAARKQTELATMPEPPEVAIPDFDFTDMLWGFPVAVSAAHLNLPAVVLTGVAFAAQKQIRRTPGLAGKIYDVLLHVLPLPDWAMHVLPAPTPRVLSAPNVQDVAPGVQPAPAAPATLHEALHAMPRQVQLGDMGKPPASATAVPIGYGADGSPLWLDMANEMLHTGLYGTSGAGKDTWLRTAFGVLTRRNTPDQVQFFILDAKGDWMLSHLKGLAHMWRDPVGGVGGAGVLAIKSGVQMLHEEMERRYTLVLGASCRTREQYIQRTGRPMPLLIVVFTDVMSSIESEVESLLVDLVSKARAVGIRVIVSMQTPTGGSMKWRSNLSTNITGMIPDDTQNGPALGLREASKLRYKPSELPHPKERPGVMVVRHGNQQHLVQGVYVPEEKFDAAVTKLPQRDVPKPIPADDQMLARLLQQAPQSVTKASQSPSNTSGVTVTATNPTGNSNGSDSATGVTVTRDGGGDVHVWQVNRTAPAEPAVLPTRRRRTVPRVNVREMRQRAREQQQETLEQKYARLVAQGVPSFREAYKIVGGNSQQALAAWHAAGGTTKPRKRGK